MKIGERKALKPMEVVFLLIVIGGMMFGLYKYRALFLKKSANMFDEVMKNTMEQAKALSKGSEFAGLFREGLGLEQKTEHPEEIKKAGINKEFSGGKRTTEKGEKSLKKAGNFIKGIEFINQGDDQKAIEYLSLAINDQENDPEPHFWLGVSYLNTKQPKQAIPAFERALEFAPDNVEYLMNLSMAYFKSGAKDKARQTLAKAQKIAPDNRLVKETLNWLR